MMLKRYLPGFLIVVLITALGFALWAHTNRLNAAKNQAQAVQLAFDQYKVEQQAEVQREQQRLIQQYNQALEQKNEAIIQLEKSVDTAAIKQRDTDRVLNTANANLRQAREAAKNGTCADAQSAARMCADMYAKLDERVRRDERRVSAISQYADQLKIELGACIAAY